MLLGISVLRLGGECAVFEDTSCDPEGSRIGEG